MFGLGPRRGRRRTHRQIVLNEFLERIRPFVLAGLKVAALLALCAATAWGLVIAEARQHRLPSNQRAVQFVLPDMPPGPQASLENALADVAGRPWIDPQLCRAVHAALVANGWVRHVNRVSKVEPGVVHIDCEHRSPVAVVQYREYFYLVDEYGVRLPGEYGYEPGWLLIQGAVDPPPDPGHTWPGQDVSAGLQLANLIRGQPFGHQVAVILLHNYGGRQDPYSSHIELMTERSAGRILWGSAPGEEIEENSAEEKLYILAENYRRHGRIDAGHPAIDVSVFPDRFLIPG